MKAFALAEKFSALHSKGMTFDQAIASLGL